jgi:hypothetical protein
MNNEPVAWIPKGMTLAKPKDLTNCIPLYTHPAKELTDDEITDIASTLLIATDSIVYEWGVCVTEFARAILRKAQEK